MYNVFYRKTLLSLILSTIVFAVLGCAMPLQPSTAEPTTITIVDSAGREVTIPESVRTVAFSSSFTAEAIKAVGAWDMVVGRDGYMTDAILYPNIGQVPAISSPTDQYDLNYEEILELNPDIFIAPYTEDNRPGLDTIVANLEPEIPVVALDFFDPQLIAVNIRTLGLILGKSPEAEEFATFYEGIERRIRDEVSGLPVDEQPVVFYQLGYSQETFSTFTNEMPAVEYQFNLVGSQNIAADFPGVWVESLDKEWLITSNPDVVFISIYDFSTPDTLGFGIEDTAVAEQIIDEVLVSDVFAESNAANQERIYLIHSDLTAGPRFIVGLAYLAKWFHPDRFEDLDPHAIHQDYLKRFMRIDFDLDERGLFVFPSY